jgi:hypothetical protein
MSARNIEIKFYFWKMTLHTSCKCTHKWECNGEQSLRAKVIARAAVWLPSIEHCKSAAFTVHNTLHTWGNFSRRPWSPLTKEPSSNYGGGRGRGMLTGTGDKKGLLQPVYMGLTKPTSLRGNSKPKRRMSYLKYCLWISLRVGQALLGKQWCI